MNRALRIWILFRQPGTVVCPLLILDCNTEGVVLPLLFFFFMPQPFFVEGCLLIY